MCAYLNNLFDILFGVLQRVRAISSEFRWVGK